MIASEANNVFSDLLHSQSGDIYTFENYNNSLATEAILFMEEN